jgi:hypothetical protein
MGRRGFSNLFETFEISSGDENLLVNIKEVI